MPEGRVVNNSGAFNQEFIITDQQGNARVSFQNNGSGSAVVKQENSYYGFGMQLANSPVTPTGTPNKRLYNGGFEWQSDYPATCPIITKRLTVTTMRRWEDLLVWTPKLKAPKA